MCYFSRSSSSCFVFPSSVSQVVLEHFDHDNGEASRFTGVSAIGGEIKSRERDTNVVVSAKG